MTAPDPAKRLGALLRRVRSAGGDGCADPAGEGRPESADPLLWQLVYSFLAWESVPSKAALANKRLHSAVVDYNEMRVCLADELAGIIGDRYPRGVERASRLRSTLNEIYRREHAVTLNTAAAMAKREARQYLESLEGMPGFVAARVLVLSMGGHAFPLDERLHSALVDEEAVPAGLPLAEASGWLERQFRAGEAGPSYLLLEWWMNERAAKSGAKKGKGEGEGEPGRPRRAKTRARRKAAKE